MYRELHYCELQWYARVQARVDINLIIKRRERINGDI